MRGPEKTGLYFGAAHPARTTSISAGLRDDMEHEGAQTTGVLQQEQQVVVGRPSNQTRRHHRGSMIRK
jgi:hypothetical protein